MTKNLVIVESPAKARTIERYLGPDYRVLASFGHVRDLPENPGFVEGHTFEGNPISCAAGIAVLSEIIERDLCANARAMGERLRAGLENLRKYGIIGTPEQCAEAIERFVAGGCNYILMNAICDPADERAQLEAFAADILPRFRGR